MHLIHRFSSRKSSSMKSIATIYLQVELENIDTKLRHLPAESRAVAVSTISTASCTKVQWLRNNLGLVLDVVVAVEVCGSDDRSIDTLVSRHVQGQGDGLVQGVDDLEVDAVLGLIKTGNPEHGVDLTGSVFHRKNMSTLEAGEDPLDPVTGGEDGVVGVSVVRDQIGCPVGEIAVLERRSVRGHLDRVGITLSTDGIYTLSDGGEQTWVEDVRINGVGVVDDSVGCINLNGTVFTKEDSDISIVGRFLPVIPLVEVLEEPARILEMDSFI